METIRLTTAEAIVRWLVAQRTILSDAGPTGAGVPVDAPMFPGVYAIFGHGNVTCLGLALEGVRDELPTWRGQNEQGMALAAVAYAKAVNRRQIMVASSSVGPGATNMVTAAGVAMANRLPVLLLAGDTFNSRGPDPVLQQVEHFGSPSTTVNDAFRAVTRYWDRITSPEQILQALPQALAMMLDPADCGPAFLGLPQDVQAEAYDFPVAFFERRVHVPVRPRADRAQLAAAADALRDAERPVIISGGGVRYSGAEAALASFADAHGIPVVETVAGRTTLLHSHPSLVGPIGVTGSAHVNRVVASADVVLAIGTRLQDFTTNSWTLFTDDDVRIVGINAARFDAHKHLALPVVGDALECLHDLDALVDGYRAPATWLASAQAEKAAFDGYIDSIQTHDDATTPTYAQVVGAVLRQATPADYVLAAAGGFPGELNNGWRGLAVDSFDLEYGFSCMGYELSGAWGARMAHPAGDVFAFVGDGSYLMMNSDLYSTVLAGHKVIALVCDNGGFAVIDRLQVNQGGESFNNLLRDCRLADGMADPVTVDFAAHAASMGCRSEKVKTITELQAALVRARAADRSAVIVIDVDAHAWTDGGGFWEVGVPEVSDRPAVQAARQAMDDGKQQQRMGW